MVRSRPGRWLAGFFVLLGALAPAVAQAPQPQLPFGLWVEVISVSDKWVVVQNENGQQYPISIAPDVVDLFLVRWPTTLDRLGPEFLVEATGLIGNNNALLAPHVDVFRGANQFLVAPTSQPLVEARPLYDPMNVMMMNIFGPVFYLPPQEANVPRRMHVVGACVGNAPLQVSQGGGVVFGVVADTMTEVTRGSVAMVRPGDLAFCMVDGWNGRTLGLAELIVYKPMPIDQFAP